MTDTAMPSAKPSLGVGTILGESFSLYFSNFVPMTIVCAVPVILSYIVSFGLIGIPDPIEIAGDPSDPFAYYRDNGVGLAISTIFSIAIWGFIAAAMTGMAYDAKVGNPVSVGQGFRAGMSHIVVAAVLVLIVYICFAIGLGLLIIPGLLIAAMWFVIIPAIVVENAGFGALGRSAALTKGYRWPLIGLLILFGLIAMIMGVIIGAVSGLAAFGAASGGLSIMMIITMVINAVLAIILYSVSGAMAALAYARLVEIKEGRGMSSLAEVFS